VPLRSLLLSITLLSLLTGCAGEPDWSPLPAQYRFQPDSEPRVVGMAIRMEEPQVDNYLVSGVLRDELGSMWRWANPRMQLRLQVAERRASTFYIDFVISETTFKETGPVTFRFLLNDQEISRATYDKPGEKHHEAPVAASLLDPTVPVTITIEADRWWTSEDGTKLAFLLVGAGFQQ
jgi:hypothetical protein